VKKRRKEPGEPKSARNAYMLYCAARRSSLQAETQAQGEHLTFGQIGARLGQIWRTLTPEQKKVYPVLTADCFDPLG
jgi:hypothetical protein